MRSELTSPPVMMKPMPGIQKKAGRTGSRRSFPQTRLACPSTRAIAGIVEADRVLLGVRLSADDRELSHIEAVALQLEERRFGVLVAIKNRDAIVVAHRLHRNSPFGRLE